MIIMEKMTAKTKKKPSALQYILHEIKVSLGLLMIIAIGLVLIVGGYFIFGSYSGLWGIAFWTGFLLVFIVPLLSKN